MTDAREKIADIIWSGWNHVDAEVSDADLIADAILSALLSIVREMIPDLEWELVAGKCYDALSVGLLYRIIHQHDGTAKLMIDSTRYGEEYSSRGEAKAAANEHHKQQILKAMGMSE